MSADTKTCLNCYHNKGRGMNGQCPRTGFLCSTEMQFGGRCAPSMKLWEPIDPAAKERTLWMRITGQHFKDAP